MDTKTKNTILMSLCMSLISFLIFRHTFIGMIPISIRNFFENLFLGITTDFGNFGKYAMTQDGEMTIFFLLIMGMMICLGLICAVEFCNDHMYD